MLHQLQVSMDVPLLDTVFLVAQQCDEDGQAACAEAIRKLPKAMISLQLPATDLLVKAIDNMRARGDSRSVRVLDDLIANLKRGQNRIVRASLSFGNVTSIGQLDDSYERMRKIVQSGQLQEGRTR